MMEKKSYRTLWGVLSRDEIFKFSLLGLGLFMIICAYWAMRSLKDPIFANLVGIHYQPKAKILSLIVMFPAILIYSRLADIYRKRHLFNIFGGFFFILLCIGSFLLRHPDWGLGTTAPGPHNVLGWIFYVSIEAFGSIMVALFWAFATGESTHEDGKKGFPFVVFLAQIGAVIGPTVVTHSGAIGIANIILGAAVASLLVPMVIGSYLRYYGSQENTATGPKISETKSAGAWAGLRILATNPYVMGIFVVSTFHEAINTILDYQMKFLATQEYPTAEGFAEFMGRYGQLVNVFALLTALIGSSYLLRRFGLRFCLVLYPVIFAALIIVAALYPTLWTIFACMVVYKVLNYSLNNPSKEILYTLTDADTRYKAKAWIDVFGARSLKGCGAVVTDTLRSSFSYLSRFGAGFSLLIIGVWIAVALKTGRQFQELAHHKETRN